MRCAPPCPNQAHTDHLCQGASTSARRPAAVNRQALPPSPRPGWLALPAQRAVRTLASGAEASGSQPDSADGFLGTKGQQGAVYQAVLAASVAGGAVLTLLPGACASALMFGASVQPAASAAATSALLGGCGGSLWLAAACAATLKEAARHDRLGSDTYKRLNLALAALAVNVLAVLLLTGLEVAKPAAAGVVGVAAVVVAAATTAIYTRSNKGEFSPLYVLSKALSNLVDFFRPQNGAAAAYSALALPSLALWVGLTLAPLSAVKLDDAAVLAAKWLGAGMALTSSVLYVQKDAADRGRLGASTFKLLNLAMSVAALVQGCWLFWLVHHQQAAAALVPPALQGALFALLAASVAYCDYQYLVAKK